MSGPTITNPAAQRYDAARRRAHDDRLPPGYPLPQPTAAWPAENVALLERFRLWLLSSSTNPELVDVVYIPTAGNALGYNLKPHPRSTSMPTWSGRWITSKPKTRAPIGSS